MILAKVPVERLGKPPNTGIGFPKPGIGFPQNISIDPYPETFRDWSRAVQDGKANDARMQLIDCIPLRSSSWPWSLTRSTAERAE